MTTLAKLPRPVASSCLSRCIYALQQFHFRRLNIIQCSTGSRNLANSCLLCPLNLTRTKLLKGHEAVRNCVFIEFEDSPRGTEVVGNSIEGHD